MTAKVGLPRLTRVHDVMQAAVVEIPVGATREVAAATLAEHHVSGAPVRSASGELMGMISASDLLDPTRSSESVDQLMTRIAYSVRAEDPVMVAVNLLAQTRVHRLLVVNANAEICGILTPTDIVLALAGGLRLPDDDDHAPIAFTRLPSPRRE
ncbi:MAG: CBS domain-containing protein [Polyangiaceae bacterium]